MKTTNHKIVVVGADKASKMIAEKLQELYALDAHVYDDCVVLPDSKLDNPERNKRKGKGKRIKDWEVNRKGR